MSRFVFGIVLCCAALLSVGCGSDQPGLPPLAPVKGTIQLDGQPVPTGELHFSMTGVPPQVLPITSGAFEGKAPVGKNKVEVFIYQEGPPSSKYGGAASKVNVAPAKYWGPTSMLETTINASGTNEVKFDMTSK
jgi:hypothetical protein